MLRNTESYYGVQNSPLLWRVLKQPTTSQFINFLKPTGHVMHQQFNLIKPTGYMMHQKFNLLKPTGHVMHQQFNIQQLYVLPTLYLCVLYLSENKQRHVPLIS